MKLKKAPILEKSQAYARRKADSIFNGSSAKDVSRKWFEIELAAAYIDGHFAGEDSASNEILDTVERKVNSRRR